MDKCPHCLGEHELVPEGAYFDFKGWRFTPPFICMGCGIETCYKQWAFSRSCGSCDVSHSPTRRLQYGACFVGPHTQIQFPIDPRDPGALLEGNMLDPADREKYPVINPPKPLFEFPPDDVPSDGGFGGIIQGWK
jgi:hypothetical protein